MVSLCTIEERARFVCLFTRKGILNIDAQPCIQFFAADSRGVSTGKAMSGDLTMPEAVVWLSGYASAKTGFCVKIR